MNIACPYCNATLTPKSLKPGRYTPKCPKCGRPFVVDVPADDEADVIVEEIDPKPLPKTTPVPIVRRPKSQPEHTDDDDEDLPVSEEEDEGTSDDDSDDIGDFDREAVRKPVEKPLPKTQPYPIVRKPKQPESEDEEE